MAYDTTEAVAKFLSGFQMKITNRERDTVAPDYYVKYLLTLSKGGKDFSTTFVSDPRAFGEPTVTQVFSALADDALTLRKYSTDEFVDKLYAQGVKPSAALRAYDSCKETNLWMQDAVFAEQWKAELSECDIDPEAVSVDSEAHDMENGRDGLDDNAPEKDAPEKDDRNAQPPVDTDNR